MLVATKYVLVVDDDEDCRILAQRVLLRAGYQVDMALEYGKLSQMQRHLLLWSQPLIR